ALAQATATDQLKPRAGRGRNPDSGLYPQRGACSHARDWPRDRVREELRSGDDVNRTKVRPPGGHRHIGAEPVGDQWLFPLRVNCQPAAVIDLHLIGSLDLSRNPFRISGFLDVQGATQAKDADQTNVVIQHCRSLGATVEASQLPRAVALNNNSPA